jgi:GGDEF domain-containing protein
MNDKEFRAADGRTFRAGASFGIALWHEGMKNASDLLEAADHALYEAKAASRSRRGSSNRQMALVS